MIARPDLALEHLCTSVLALAGDSGSAYGMADAGMISMLVQHLGVEAGRSVANLCADGAQLKTLYTDAKHAPEGDARRAFIGSEPASLHLSDLTSWHAQGMALLIALHAWAEDHDPALEARIWDFLRDHTERNRLGD